MGKTPPALDGGKAQSKAGDNSPRRPGRSPCDDHSTCRHAAMAPSGIRIAFDTRTCRSRPSAQSLYTVDVHTRRSSAASRTERNRGRGRPCTSGDCNSGVTRGGRKPPKSCQTARFSAAPVPEITSGCDALPGSATPDTPPVTPEATGSSPVHPATFPQFCRVVASREPDCTRFSGADGATSSNHA